MTTYDRGGRRLRPLDRVVWHGREYEVLALWRDADDGTNVSLMRLDDDNLHRVKSSDLTLLQARDGSTPC